MPTKKKPSPAQIAARKKFVEMVRAKAKAKKSASKHTDTKSHNVNIKVVSGTKKKSATRQTGTSVKSKDKLRSALPPGKRTVGKGKAKHTYIERRANRSDKPGSLTGISNIGRNIGNIPKPNDIDAVREIELFIENDYQLYRSQTNPILINLTKKFKKGTFDLNKASKLFRYLIDSGMKKYHKEYGTGKDWHKLLSTHDRQYLAEQMAKHTLIELQAGNEWN